MQEHNLIPNVNDVFAQLKVPKFNCGELRRFSVEVFGKKRKPIIRISGLNIKREHFIEIAYVNVKLGDFIVDDIYDIVSFYFKICAVAAICFPIFSIRIIFIC